MISIMILTWNRVDDFYRLMDSLESTLTRPDVECLILDNGSQPENRDRVAEIDHLLRGPELQIILNPDNQGVAAGRQKLLERAQGDTLIFLDSDTVIRDPDWLALVERALEPENVGLCGPAGSYVPANWRGFIPARPGPCDVVSGWLQAFKSEVVAAGAALDPLYGLFFEEDSDFCLQVRDLGWDVLNTGYIGVDHFPGNSGAALADRESTMGRFRAKWSGRGLIKAEGGYR